MLLAITSTGKVTLIVVAGTFIVWALVTSILVPRRMPDFPSKVAPFVAVTALLFAAQMGAVFWVTQTQEVETEAAAGPEGGGEETTPAETTPAETTPTESTPTESTPAESTPTESTPAETTPATAGGDATAGKAVFASAGCTGCHTLSDAGATGNVGPNLDDEKPDFDLVVMRVTNGKGVMPSFKGQLSETQIKDVAAYVSSVDGS